MSLTFTQITSLIDLENKTNTTSYPLADKVLDINVALNDAIDIAIKTCGIGNFDDSNHTDYPIITTNLVSGQRDISYTVDGSSNLVLDIYKVLVMNPAGIYVEIPQVDVQTEYNTQSFTDGQNQTGTPSSFDITGNGIIFDVVPNYSQTAGIKIYINREGSVFTTADTTKKPGIDGRLHEYLVVSPAFKYASRNSLATQPNLEKRKLELEAKIERVYGKRNKSVRPVLSSASSKINHR